MKKFLKELGKLVIFGGVIVGIILLAELIVNWVCVSVARCIVFTIIGMIITIVFVAKEC